jgi:tetratricopeptide (TPR) repeat protein
MNLNKLIQSKQYEKAINECKSLIADAELDDDKSAKLTGLVYLGIIYTQQGFFYKSKDLFDTHFNDIVSECKFYWSGKELIDTYVFYNELGKAESYIDAYIDNNKDSKALLTKGNLLYKRKEYSEAIEILQQANSLEPNNKQILFSLGVTEVELKNNQKAFKYFEKSFDLGLDDSISEIMKLIFTRTATCNYKNCIDTCCKKVILTGIDGKSVNDENSFNLLLNNDSRNKCWIKQESNSENPWIFDCKNLGTNNICTDYENRPENCRSYPSSILNMRKACSYKFELADKNILFSSTNCFKVVLHILKTYKYESEMNQILNDNKTLLSE